MDSITAGIKGFALTPTRQVVANLSTAQLVEEALRRNECRLTAHGPIATVTGKHTGRSANDKFTVDEPSTTDEIWWGKVNCRIDESSFNSLRDRTAADLEQQDLFVFEGYAGADSNNRLKVRVITPNAWHCLFARNMFIPETDPAVLDGFEADFTILHNPEFRADPETDGTNSETFILLSFAEQLVLIGGTQYAGEIKKSIFSVLNRLLPNKGILSMHCSANYGGSTDDVALFFGLSGTGKTTLSADPERVLIGDDEHGWSDDGVFNFEGGCYAKVIDLTEEGEPEIWHASHRFGAILENVIVDEQTRLVDFEDVSLTQNTRSSYPVSFIPNMDPGGQAGHPRHIVFLTADAFGVLPPIAKLTTAQAMYHFLAGYTAKVAGTEMGVKEPQATFSACFGAPFLPLHPNTYAELLAKKIEEHKPGIWLVNTGWTGGPYGEGTRMKLSHTRRMVRAALAGELDNARYETDPVFGLQIPVGIDGVPSEILNPRKTWADPEAYDQKAAELAAMFVENFSEFEDTVAAEVVAAGPKVTV